MVRGWITLDIYKFLNDTKDEINSFVDIINKNINYKDKKNNNNKDDLKFIAKRIFFLKEIFKDKENAYSDLVIYSILQMLYNTVFENICTEKYNLYKRIYIENLFRYLLNVDNTRKSIGDMKDLLKEDANIKSYIDSLYSEHSKASGVIHVNKIQYVNINKYFVDIIEMNKKFEHQSFITNIKNIIYLLRISTSILLIKKHEIIGCVFYNNMEILKYLIGDKNYKLYYNNLY